MNPLTPEDRALLDLARGADDPSASDDSRVRGALLGKLGIGTGLGVVATATATATSTAAASALPLAAGAGAGAAAGGLAAAVPALSFASKVLLATLAIGGVTSGGVAAFHAIHAARAPDAAPVASAPGPAQEPVAAPRARPEIRPMSVDPVPAAPQDAPIANPIPVAPSPPPPLVLTAPARAARPAETSDPVAARAPVAVPGAPPIDEPTPVLPDTLVDPLISETRLMNAAMTALGAGDAARALTLFDQHAREFPGGVLVEERSAERVLALCQLGRDADAARAAAAFVREHPSSRLTGRVRASCVRGPTPGDEGRPIP